MSNIYCFLIRPENIYHRVDRRGVLLNYVLKNLYNWCECDGSPIDTFTFRLIFLIFYFRKENCKLIGESNLFLIIQIIHTAVRSYVSLLISDQLYIQTEFKNLPSTKYLSAVNLYSSTKNRYVISWRIKMC